MQKAPTAIASASPTSRAVFALGGLRLLRSGVFACSAKTGEGVEEGVSWLLQQLKIRYGAQCLCQSQQALPCFLQDYST